jgi:hypothetical protein
MRRRGSGLAGTSGGTAVRARSAALAVLLAAAVALAAAGPGWSVAHPAAVVANVQIVELGADRYVIVLRSTTALPFDVVASTLPTRVQVRLYRTTLGIEQTIETASFGTVSLAEEPAGHVLVRVDLADRAYRARVRQGANANTVEIAISR